MKYMIKTHKNRRHLGLFSYDMTERFRTVAKLYRNGLLYKTAHAHAILEAKVQNSKIEKEADDIMMMMNDKIAAILEAKRQNSKIEKEADDKMMMMNDKGRRK